MEMDGDTLSAIFGWISMGCWIVVYTPQLIENYRLQSGEGLSILFLFGWILGDACNIVGAVIGGLVPSVIWLGSYHLFSDLLLLSQIYYYRWKRSRWPIGPIYDLPTPNISTTVLASETGDYNYNYNNYAESTDSGVPPSRPTTTWAKRHAGRNGTAQEEEETLIRVIIRSILCLILISALGIAAWWVDEWYTGGVVGGESEATVVNPELIRVIPGGVFGKGTWGDLEWLREPLVQVLGWTSATLYIASNLPQIFKNFETRCEGLSPSLFVFTAFGSCTYVLSILSKSFEKDYLITNAGWLAGHGLSCCLDFVVIGQIVYYRFTERGRMRSVYTVLH